MGIAFSSTPPGRRDAENVTSESETIDDTELLGTMEDKETELEEQLDDEARAKSKEDEMNEFRKQLNIKREQRREILARHRHEKEDLEKSLHEERVSKFELCESNNQLRELLSRNNITIPEDLCQTQSSGELSLAVMQLRDEFEKLKSSNNKLRQDLADSNFSLQHANSDIAELHAQNRESMKQINALKEVVTVSKTMINLREEQLNGLKKKLQEIETSLADRETNLLSADLRQEYEKQLLNIRTLRVLYEERARLAEVTRQGLVRDLEEQKRLHQAEVNKSKELKTTVDDLEEKVDKLHDIIENKNNQISSCQDEKNELKAEMAVINKLFSQVLLGYKSKQDLDKLVHRLEENHGILTHMAEKEKGSESSTALPKLLLELVSQVDDNEESNNDTSDQNHESEPSKDNDNKESENHNTQNATAEEIVENLPKVWKVLMELLSHQTVAEPDITEKVTTCYKSVETKSGPVLVPSVSQTYIRLKDLILEKLGLVKEVNQMKQLNSHLETRLQEQEKRLCLVTTELSKTWHVVSRLRKHHHQLHTHEKILKYELQQKRKLLNELKEELEYCREKWEQAREKNTQSERDWRKLRAEFSSRKTKSNSPLHNSAESGYSDEKPSDESSESDDESEYVTEPLLRSKKKVKKSLENILDSSTVNLAAEREDPVSDLIDVAELPLDTHDVDDNQYDISETSRSKPVHLSNKTCAETEDELCDMAHDDSCNEAPAIEPDESNLNDSHNSQSTSTKVSIDPSEILRNIRQQNERLAKKDQKFEQLEKFSMSLLNKTQATVRLGNELNNTLDHLLSRSTSGGSLINQPNPLEQNRSDSFEAPEERLTQECVSKYSSLEDQPASSSETIETNIQIFQNDNDNQPQTNLSTILENVQKQTLEAGCTEVIGTLSNSTTSSENTIENLDSLQERHSGSDETTENDTKKEAVDSQLSEPTTSSQNDHEARFAARDLRLKRLEEQTKSLVTKVNRTTSKGVKINYKLDELHNIYGSENSRAGTPSEENEDKSTEDDLSGEAE